MSAFQGPPAHFGGSPRRGRARSGGFTLIELMISLVMGLIVALASVALSRAATTTFYEQARISSVEANVRTASERFRSDLMRVGYMSTPSIQFDPKVANIPGGAGAAYRVPALKNLQGLAISPAASGILSNTLTTTNSLTPHDVIVTGNLTSDDVYRGIWIGTGGCGGDGTARIRLDGAADPAVRRLYNGETTAAGRKQMTEIAFMPGERMVDDPSTLGRSYAVQVMDARGCFHYMTICAVVQDAQANAVVLELAGTTTQGLLTPADTGGDICGASLMEEVAVAPVQRVRWYIGPETLASRNDPDPAADGPLASTRKFNLYRQLIDADTTATAAAPNPVGASPIGAAEVVAEYAIDLKLGLIIDSTLAGAVGTTNVDLEGVGTDADFLKWASPTATFAAEVGPQRIRAVRYRMAFRTPLPDRKADLLMGAPGQPYLARYWLAAGSYSRVRTVMSEVALMNQARAVY